MQFAGEFIVPRLPVAVMWSTAVGMLTHNAMTPFFFFVRVCGPMCCLLFLADRTNGRAIATLLRLSVVVCCL